MNRLSIGHTSLRVAPTDLQIASIAAVGASDKTAEPPFHDPRANMHQPHVCPRKCHDQASAMTRRKRRSG